MIQSRYHELEGELAAARRTRDGLWFYFRGLEGFEREWVTACSGEAIQRVKDLEKDRNALLCEAIDYLTYNASSLYELAAEECYDDRCLPRPAEVIVAYGGVILEAQDVSIGDHDNFPW